MAETRTAPGRSRTTHHTACPLDCPDACSLEIVVEDGRVVALDGTHRNRLTAGFICGKVRRFADHLHGADRLRYPMIRTGPKGEGAFARVTWDAAFDRIVRELRSAIETRGAETILPFCYGGSNGYLTQNTLDARLFRRLGASRLARTVCAAATGRAAEGLYGRMPGVPLSDYPRARLIVIWGTNPSATGIHLVPIVKEARRRGARLVVVDPRRTPLARQADLHLALRPGTDLPVALSVVSWLFDSGRADATFLSRHAIGVEGLRERAREWSFARASDVSGVPEADLQRLASMYADASPAVIRCGWGLERNRNGGSAVAAVLALPAVAGKFGVAGGGYTMSNSGAWPFSSDAAAGEPEPPTRLINMNRLGHALTGLDDPPVSVLFVYNCNPLATMPHQSLVRRGLERDDLFTIVFDQVMTDTARHADVLLPATTFLEHDELSRGYGAMVLNRIRPVVAPEGEARSNPDVFGELCRRLDLTRPGEPESAAELERAILGGSTVDETPREPDFVGEDGSVIQFVDVSPRTPGGKIDLLPASLDAEAPEGLYRYRPDPGTARHPLALISPATHRTISSTFGQLHRGQVPIEMNPADAAHRGIGGGDEVRVFNELGEVRCRAAISEDMPPGVVCLPKGIWSHNTLNGATANALCPDSLADLGGAACFNDARVEVAPAGSSAERTGSSGR